MISIKEYLWGYNLLELIEKNCFFFAMYLCCRHWQELGYLIIYVTGRPDMQQRRVVSWLAQHNFPHGLLSFADGLSTDPLRHKAEYLKVSTVTL